MVTSPAIDATAQVAGWYLYRFRPRPGVVCGMGPSCRIRHTRMYIGISNRPWRRHFEHLRDKDWIDDVAGYDIDPRTFTSEADARAAEKAAIHAELPLANDVHNRGNPHRLIYGDTPARVRRPVRTQFSRRIPSPVRREWSRRQQQVAAVAAVAAVLAGVGWWAVCRWLPVGPADGALDGAVAASALLTLAGALSVRTRGRGAGWGRFWRAVGLCAAGAGAVFLLWHLGPAIMLLSGAHGTGPVLGRV